MSVRVFVAGTMGWYNLILAGYWMWRVLAEVTIVVGAGGYELPLLPLLGLHTPQQMNCVWCAHNTPVRSLGTLAKRENCHQQCVS